MKIKNIILLSIKLSILLIIFFHHTSYSQMSKKEIDKERALYKNNKVKSVIITGNKGFKNITEIDSEGKKIKSNDFYNNEEANITNYEYDLNGNLTEESYYGYESGDGSTSIYEYDEIGNIKSILTEGIDDHKSSFRYDNFGNVTLIEISDIGLNPQPPFIKEFENIYMDERISTITQICNSNFETADYTEYAYDNDVLLSVEDFEKNCIDGTLKFTFRKTYTYFPNMLVKQTSSEYDYNKSVEINKYDYENYR